MSDRLRLSRSDDNFYAWSTLDRASARRGDAGWLEAQLRGPQGRLVPVWRSRNLIDPGAPPEDPPEATMLPAERFGALLERGDAPLFLGLHGGLAYFASDLSSLEQAEAESICGVRADLKPNRAEFLDLRFTGPMMNREHGNLLAYARGMLTWRRRHRFCGVCGAATEPKDGGHLRVCSDERCATSHFPRTDPAVIMLVTFGDKCLLGRQKVWPPGMHSTLAGFVEPGETLEMAVAREVFEESGVRVHDVRYHSSQPWPFPTSLMLGFHARALSDDLDVNTEELEMAAWFRRDWVIEQIGKRSETFKLPRRDSIARQLCEDWLAGRAG